jgi:phosphonopyruvate decarboxylase
MIKAEHFLDGCLARGFDFFTGTPCSYLKPLINYTIDHERFRFLDASNEGDAVAIASGVTIAGGKAVVMFQNSGLGNAVNPLTSLTHTFQIPVLLIVTHRGEPGGEHDEPQHDLMGTITTDLLATMRIGWARFPDSVDAIGPCLDAAVEYMRVEQRPYALVMRKNDVEPYALQQASQHGPLSLHCNVHERFNRPVAERSSRREALEVIQDIAGDLTVVIGTTGFTGRELCELNDKASQFYIVGSMGCALPLGLGMALQKPSVRFIVVDGDGALLMRTGTMGTVGARLPQNLLHLLLDNEAHDSTGGQSTVAPTVSFAAIARGFGYPSVCSTDDILEFRAKLSEAISAAGPSFIHFKIRCGAMKNLSRPSVTPVEVKQRLMQFLELC